MKKISQQRIDEIKNKKKNIVVMLIGGSGSGKSTLESNLVKLAPEQFKKVVSATTRPMRAGEKDGVDYYYMNKEEFDKTEMVERVEFGKNHYGVPAFEFETDKDLVIVVEPHGAEQIIEYIKDTNNYLVIFMGGASRENMLKRGDSEADIEKRLADDDIEERFKNSSLVADKTIKNLNDSLHLTVYEYIQIFKKNLN